MYNPAAGKVRSALQPSAEQDQNSLQEGVTPMTRNSIQLWLGGWCAARTGLLWTKSRILRESILAPVIKPLGKTSHENWSKVTKLYITKLLESVVLSN
jgi:hypothetical protein